MLKFQLLFSLIFVCLVNGADVKSHVIEVPAPTQYEPTWDSLDSRPLPAWFDDAKIGIFIHWGVFSVPSFSSEWFWSQWKSNNPSVVEFMNKNYPPNFTYQEFAKEFRAEFYDPNKWADLFQASGAKYVVLTSKHHEGYTLWPSKYSFSWNAKDVGPNRDLLGDLAAAIRNRTDLKFGLYHSLYEWYNPLYVQDKNNGFNTSYFVHAKTIPELHELIDLYKPEVIWSDGDWEAYDDYWTSREFLAWLYNESPVKDTVVVNDRWGIDIPCKHGDFYSCQDRYSPGVLQPHKWENAMTIDKQSWGFRREASLSDYMTIEELLEELVKTVSTGGNILMNVGPTSSGIIAPIFEERLRQVGSWLNLNGEAIYSSRPWTYQNDTLTSNVWYTKNGNYVYANVLFWPENGLLKLGAPELSTNATVCLLSYSDCNLDWKYSSDELQIQFPEKALVKSNWAYVLKFSDVTN